MPRSALVGSFPLVPPSSSQRRKGAPAPAPDGVDGDDDDALVADSLARRRLAGAHHAAVMSELQHAIVSAAH